MEKSYTQAMSLYLRTLWKIEHDTLPLYIYINSQSLEKNSIRF